EVRDLPESPGARAAHARHYIRRATLTPPRRGAGGGPRIGEVVGAGPPPARTAHAPLLPGRPEVSRPDQRDRLYAGFHELRRRLAAARPDLLVLFVNDHLQNFAYNNLPAFG